MRMGDARHEPGPSRDGSGAAPRGLWTVRGPNGHGVGLARRAWALLTEAMACPAGTGEMGTAVARTAAASRARVKMRRMGEPPGLAMVSPLDPHGRRPLPSRR